jgi:putative ABC transport system ATP-binding protein
VSVVIVAEGVHRRYRAASGPVAALVDVSLQAPAGALTVVAGPSGSGKSTLLRILAGLDRADCGSVVVAGTELTRASARTVRRTQRRDLAYVFQQPVDNLLAYLDAGAHVSLWRRLRGLAPAAEEEWLATVGLSGCHAAVVEQLSGGEQQRLAFSAAAASEPAVVLADEPTSQLDANSTGLLVDAIARLRDKGRTLVIASHDPRVVEAADQIVRLDHGRRT